jgi:hypothetical protein
MIDNAWAFYGAYVVCYDYEDFSWLDINEGGMVKELKRKDVKNLDNCIELSI